MLYILDTANIEEIRRCVEFYPVSGVTTNPTIISKEHTGFLGLIKTIRKVIGPDRMFHIQTTGATAEAIVKEAQLLAECVGGDFYVKIPITPEGIKATMALKKLGIKVTETAIFTPQQALIAAKAGADFVAPYVNRLDNIVSDGVQVVEEIVKLFRNYNLDCRVLAASFKTVEQVHKIALTGCHAVTVASEVIDALLYHPMTQYAIDDFNVDWESVYGKETILDMFEKK